MAVDAGGKVRLEIDGRAMFPIPVRTPLDNLSFKAGVLRGPFLGTIDTPDTARASHVVLLNVKLRGGKLNGSASAVAMDGRFLLPFWIELARAAVPRLSSS